MKPKNVTAPPDSCEEAKCENVWYWQEAGKKKKTCLQELGESQHLNNSEIDVVMQMSDIMFEQKVTHSHNLKLLLLMKH